MKEQKTGTLYAIGTGPGAPDLLTVRAVEILRKIDVVLTAASPKNDYSAALNCARRWLAENVEIARLDFPMTRDKKILHAAWTTAASKCASFLDDGKNAAFLTIGDPLIYSTFGYLWRALLKIRPDSHIEIVPGITSFQAAAAKAKVILCEGRESLRIISGIDGEQNLIKELADADSAVILKAYRNFKSIKRALENTGRAKDCILASFVEQKEEIIKYGLEENDGNPPYMSLLLSVPERKKN